jgi:hypothetical protein
VFVVLDLLLGVYIRGKEEEVLDEDGGIFCILTFSHISLKRFDGGDELLLLFGLIFSCLLLKLLLLLFLFNGLPIQKCLPSIIKAIHPILIALLMNLK